MSLASDPRLKPVEKLAVRIGHFINERPVPNAIKMAWHKSVGRAWVGVSISNLLHVEGVEHLRALPRDRGVLMCSNHRSFFDQYVISYELVRNVSWLSNLIFPVRNTFFYESVAGIFVNLLFGAGCMYPPVYRERERADLTKLGWEKLVEFLHEPGAFVGVHPEGTRGKGPDPYEFLPAQPGVGQLAMMAKVPVLPVFIHGLGNDLPAQIASNFKDGGRDVSKKIIIVFGPPVDLDELMAGKPRPAQYKRVADKIMDAIKPLAARERQIRAELEAATV